MHDDEDNAGAALPDCDRVRSVRPSVSLQNVSPHDRYEPIGLASRAADEQRGQHGLNVVAERPDDQPHCRLPTNPIDDGSRRLALHLDHMFYRHHVSVEIGHDDHRTKYNETHDKNAKCER